MYFDDCDTIEECKSKYKELAKKMHPDVGGTKEEFQQLFDEYTDRLVDMAEENTLLSPEYVNLANALAGVFKAKEPEKYNRCASVLNLAKEFLPLFESNKTAKNVGKFIDKLDL